MVGLHVSFPSTGCQSCKGGSARKLQALTIQRSPYLGGGGRVSLVSFVLLKESGSNWGEERQIISVRPTGEYFIFCHNYSDYDKIKRVMTLKFATTEMPAYFSPTAKSVKIRPRLFS